MLDKIEDYQKFAIRTIKPDSRNRLILRCTMGMVGEIGEFIEIAGLDTMKRKLELGDCMWYAANLCEVLGLSIHEILVNAQSRDIGRNYPNSFGYLPAEVRAVIWAAHLCDLVKKIVFYNKTVDDGLLITPLTNYIGALVDLADIHSLPVYEVLRANIAKLEERYPNLVFDAQNALNRNYDAEELATQNPVDG
jgi:NTP pyrophosphatase (non-canonical NTP hydrolase)